MLSTFPLEWAAVIIGALADARVVRPVTTGVAGDVSPPGVPTAAVPWFPAAARGPAWTEDVVSAPGATLVPGSAERWLFEGDLVVVADSGGRWLFEGESMVVADPGAWRRLEDPVRGAADLVASVDPGGSEDDGGRAAVAGDGELRWPGAAAPARGGRDAFVESVDDTWVESPVEPAEPVVSAYDSGIEVIADPTPKATASAPMRPTLRELP